MKLETIYKATKSGKVQEWTIEIEDNKYRTISGQTDGKKITNKWTTVFGKNISRANATTDNEQAIKEATSKRTIRLEHGYFEDITKIHESKYFEPMSAKKWEDSRDKIEYPIFSQPKLDGIRCILNKDGMFSRNGKPILSAPHIYESIKPIFDIIPSLIFDGELYADKYANDFNKIVSLVKKTKPTSEDLEQSKNNIQYWIYDLPSVDEVFKIRSQKISTLFTQFPYISTYCENVDTDVCKSETDVMDFYGKYVGAGFEGQMLRTNSLYESKRSKTLLKHKSFSDMEFPILDIVEGEGNKTGQVGYMVFEIDGKQFKSNVKGTHKFCKEVLEDKNNLLVKSATVQYLNLTPAGIPRFPYVIKINREEYE